MKRRSAKIFFALVISLSVISKANVAYAATIDDPISQYDQNVVGDDIEDKDAEEAAIYEPGVVIGGIEKTDETCELTIEAKGLEYLNEDFDKEIYALLTEVYNYSEYGVILDKEHDYKATINIPEGQYILSNVGLTHGPAIDYYSNHKEVTCEPGTSQDFWFKLYSHKVEMQKAGLMQEEAEQENVEPEEKEATASVTAATVNVSQGKNFNVVKIEAPKKDSYINMIIIVVLAGIIFIVIKKYQDKKRKNREKELQDDVF